MVSSTMRWMRAMVLQLFSLSLPPSLSSTTGQAAEVCWHLEHSPPDFFRWVGHNGSGVPSVKLDRVFLFWHMRRRPGAGLSP
ncbi:hypothetical protein QBC35DRAFT_501210 [Podospora australis]|uniref:Secreted protein n=1 Tax=Podospora australis TaxID=1536484 RepID=A0AAN6WQT4_9PEZI|nr:hypothetical protein QBC35DRAFT_501210 [Podospora australis]